MQQLDNPGMERHHEYSCCRSLSSSDTWGQWSIIDFTTKQKCAKEWRTERVFDEASFEFPKEIEGNTQSLPKNKLHMIGA